MILRDLQIQSAKMSSKDRAQKKQKIYSQLVSYK